MDSLPSDSIVAKRPLDQEPFIHPMAIVEKGAIIGARTRVWAFAHILGGAVIGEDCNICDHTFVEQGVRVGSRVTLKCGVFLWNGLVVEDDVFIGPSATLTNDLRPRSRQYPDSFPSTLLREGCTIGANATILPAISIGRWSMIGAGAVVTRTVPDYALMTGNPAKRRGWVCRCGQKLQETVSGPINCLCGLLYTLGSDQIEEIRP
jgi:acetyltransferase-like isoleucine patch superfamily enzyme